MRPSTSRLVVHAAALAVVLGGVLLVTAPGVSFTSDEGAAIVQARLLEAGHGWRYTNPLPVVDPAGRAQPFPHGDAGRKGLAPYAKHPAYPLLLTVADRALGTPGLYLLSLLGAVLAALVAAVLTRGLDSRLSVPVLWITGLVSPLFFDSFVVLAHTLAAATTAAAALLAWRALTARPSSGWPPTVGGQSQPGRWVGLVGLAACVAATVLLRSEGVFLGAGLAVAAGVLLVTRRARAGAAACVGGVALAVTVATRLLEARAVSAILGSAVALGPPASTAGFLADRYEGFYRTWLQPAYTGQGRAAALAVGAVGAAAAALLVRARAGRLPLLAALAVAVGGYVAALVGGPGGAVPGLLPAFPLVAAGAFFVRRDTLDVHGGLATFLLTAAAVAAAGVLLTQYRIGGGVEWGGRYFAYLLPLAVPALVVALVSAAAVVPARREVTAAALVVAALLPVLGVQALRHSHDATRLLVRRLDTVAAQAPPGDAGRDHRPVVISTERLLPQLAWNRFDRYRWLTPEPTDFAGYGPRLAGAGIRRIVLVTGDLRAQVRALAPWYRPVPVAVPGPAPIVAITVLERTSVP